MSPPPSLTLRYGPLALVTGAACGLGAEFARQLAQQRFGLILVDSDERQLSAVASELSSRFGVSVSPHVVDLADTAALRAFVSDIQTADIGLLISNAAESSVGRYLDLPLAPQLRSIAVNCSAPLVLTHELARPMARRGRGAMMLVSSLSAFQGAPLVAAYAGTKAFNLVLAESLWAELHPLGIDVLAVAPGPIWTPGFRASAPRAGWATSLLTAEAAQVVSEALARLNHGPTYIPGRLNRVSHRLQTLVGSRKLSTALFAAGIRRLYPTR